MHTHVRVDVYASSLLQERAHIFQCLKKVAHADLRSAGRKLAMLLKTGNNPAFGQAGDSQLNAPEARAGIKKGAHRAPPDWD